MVDHGVNRNDDHIRAFMGPGMLRMKAVLNVRGEDVPVVRA
jgi:hypothetical protein